MNYPILAAGLLAASGAIAQDAPVLTVYTYESFNTEWGPGPQIEANFEEICGCDLEFVGVGDGAALVSRLRLEGARTDADIVLGIDTNLTAAATETGLFAPHGLDVPALDVLAHRMLWCHWHFGIGMSRLLLPSICPETR